MTGRAVHALRVERVESPAGSDASAQLIAALQSRPGAWLGCDVEAEGLWHKRAIACAEAALGFWLDGRRLNVLPLSATGVALIEVLRPLAAFQTHGAGLTIEFAPEAVAPHPAVTLLRRFLALFAPASAELGLYGALAFDYFRLERGDSLPDDGRRRLALYFPERVLVTERDSARWISFRFPDLIPPRDFHVPPLPVARIEREDDDHPPGGHARAVAEGVARMRRGELASLVLSQTFRREVRAQPAAAFASLRERNPYPAMFFLNLGGETLFGASPDVQVRAEAEWVETAPVCGTYRRGADALADYDQGRGLLNSEVDEASLAVCADSDRNDKARVCVPGSVEQVSRRRIHFFSTIVHAVDHVRGRRRPDVDGFDIVLAHATPATVTGMPKRAAVAAIEAIEGSPRGWYAGAAVRIGSDGSCEALTLLRFARVIGARAEVRAGGSLLADSDPRREEEETRLKAETLFRVLAGETPARARAQAAALAPIDIDYESAGDPLDAGMREALAKAGARFTAGAPVRVIGDQAPGAGLPAASPDARPDVRSDVRSDTRPTLVFNNAALAMLRAEGATGLPLDPPQFGRRIACHATDGGPLAALGEFEAGLYAAHRLDRLPPGWQAAATARDGRIVAAHHPASRRVALLFRPDSVLSIKNDAGVRALRAALEWLAAPRG